MKKSILMLKAFLVVTMFYGVYLLAGFYRLLKILIYNACLVVAAIIFLTVACVMAVFSILFSDPAEDVRRSLGINPEEIRHWEV